MAAVGMETMTDSVAKAAGMAVVGSTGTQASMEVTDFMAVVASAAATASTVAVGSTAAAFMAVADSTVGEATGSCYSILLSHSNGWQTNLPAVFFCISP
jgi:hypothetical protein